MPRKAKPTLELELGEKGGRLEFKNPDELNSWLAEEAAKHRRCLVLNRT